MEKSIKKISLLALFATFFSCYGAESSEVAAPTPQLKSAIKKGPSTKGALKFYQKPLSHYQDIEHEVSTRRDRDEKMINSQARQASRFYEPVPLAVKKANETWEVVLKKPSPHSSYTSLKIKDIQERKEKLRSLLHAQEIEEVSNVMTDAEKRAQKSASDNGKRVSHFMQLAKAELQDLKPLSILLHQKYAREKKLLTAFIITNLIEQGIIHDITLKEKDFETQLHELQIHGALEAAAFQKSVQHYLEAHDYSFPESAPLPFFDRQGWEALMVPPTPCHCHPIGLPDTSATLLYASPPLNITDYSIPLKATSGASAQDKPNPNFNERE